MTTVAEYEQYWHHASWLQGGFVQEGYPTLPLSSVFQEKIGWRKDALHLLVFTTDDVPHIALDGKLGGLVQPHDGQCHLNEANEYTASDQMVRTGRAPLTFACNPISCPFPENFLGTSVLDDAPPQSLLCLFQLSFKNSL